MPEPATASAALVEALCRQTVELLSVAPVQPRRIRVYADGVGVELDLATDAQPSAPSAPSASAGSSAPTEPSGPSAPADPSAPSVSPAAANGHVLICAPTLGTFYRCPEPGAQPYVEPHDLVEAGQQLAILEAMKLMNPIEADVACRIVAVLAEDGLPVEHGQPLFAIEPT
jgi:acetyl-CoA carboxylase biotin carboxyl carrier protein